MRDLCASGARSCIRGRRISEHPESESRTTGTSISARYIKALNNQRVDGVLPNPDLVLALKANMAVLNSADAQIETWKRDVRTSQTAPSVRFLKTVPGSAYPGTDHNAGDRRDREIGSVGKIMLVRRCVGSRKIRNGQRKGSAIQKRQQDLAWRLGGGHFGSALCEDQKFYQKRNPKATPMGHQRSGAQALRVATTYQRSGCFDITKAFAEREV